jgi:hypothetical protein
MQMVIGTWTGPASYAAAGEILTHAIAKAGLGLQKIHSLQFGPLLDADGSAGAIGVIAAFDHNATSTTHGKIRALTSGLAAHTHDFLVIGGQGAAGTDTVTAPAGTDILGKQEAGNAEILGADSATKGGVVASTVDQLAGDVATATNLSAFVSRFVAIGH